jgi:hypothetical protein
MSAHDNSGRRTARSQLHAADMSGNDADYLDGDDERDDDAEDDHEAFDDAEDETDEVDEPEETDEEYLLRWAEEEEQGSNNRRM